VLLVAPVAASAAAARRDEDPQPLPGIEPYLIGDDPAHAPASGTRPDTFPFNTDPGQKRDNAGLDGARSCATCARTRLHHRAQARSVRATCCAPSAAFSAVCSTTCSSSRCSCWSRRVYFSCVCLMVGDLRLSIPTSGSSRTS